MKEETAKQLLKQSKVPTSAGFTDALMEQIEALPVRETPTFPLGRIAAWVGVIALVMSILVYRRLGAWEGFQAVSLGKTPLLIGVTLVLLLAVNYVLRLQRTQRKMITL